MDTLMPRPSAQAARTFEDQIAAHLVLQRAFGDARVANALVQDMMTSPAPDFWEDSDKHAERDLEILLQEEDRRVDELWDARGDTLVDQADIDILQQQMNAACPPRKTQNVWSLHETDDDILDRAAMAPSWLEKRTARGLDTASRIWNRLGNATRRRARR